MRTHGLRTADPLMSCPGFADQRSRNEIVDELVRLFDRIEAVVDFFPVPVGDHEFDACRVVEEILPGKDFQVIELHGGNDPETFVLRHPNSPCLMVVPKIGRRTPSACFSSIDSPVSGYTSKVIHPGVLPINI